ncbi:MAG: GntR family transcriptional regulator [Donghicola eburneus]|nr:GntR family transcriptional regulator [Donghicola eburneus]MCI5040854.1 GntR family transcriptional regulator [Donghicola eburneus]
MSQADPAGTSSTKRTAIETVRDEIKRRIFNFTLKPDERLHVDNLRRQFDVSTATLREALSRLMTDQLVVSESQRGFYVRGLSLADFEAISSARAIIEVAALRESLQHRDDNWEGELFAAFHKLKLVEDRMLGKNDFTVASEWHRRNSEFHDCLVVNCHNEWLIRYRSQLHEHSRRYLRLALGNNRAHRDVRVEHLNIFESAIRGDIEACAGYLEQHISKSVADVSQNLEQVADGDDFLKSAYATAADSAGEPGAEPQSE